MQALIEFIRESNRIEGIHRDPLPREKNAHARILACAELVMADVEAFVFDVQPGAVLRSKAGLDVCVGNYIAPRGGPLIVERLAAILARANSLDDPYDVHHAYENLHPFTDGNGRSGRALWLWMMSKNGLINQVLDLGFLHNWYYQSLASDRKPTKDLGS